MSSSTGAPSRSSGTTANHIQQPQQPHRHEAVRQAAFSQASSSSGSSHGAGAPSTIKGPIESLDKEITREALKVRSSIAMLNREIVERRDRAKILAGEAARLSDQLRKGVTAHEPFPEIPNPPKRSIHETISAYLLRLQPLHVQLTHLLCAYDTLLKRLNEDIVELQKAVAASAHSQHPGQVHSSPPSSPPPPYEELTVADPVERPLDPEPVDLRPLQTQCSELERKCQEELAENSRLRPLYGNRAHLVGRRSQLNQYPPLPCPVDEFHGNPVSAEYRDYLRAHQARLDTTLKALQGQNQVLRSKIERWSEEIQASQPSTSANRSAPVDHPQTSSSSIPDELRQLAQRCGLDVQEVSRLLDAGALSMEELKAQANEAQHQQVNQSFGVEDLIRLGLVHPDELQKQQEALDSLQPLTAQFTADQRLALELEQADRAAEELLIRRQQEEEAATREHLRRAIGEDILDASKLQGQLPKPLRQYNAKTLVTKLLEGADMASIICQCYPNKPNPSMDGTLGTCLLLGLQSYHKKPDLTVLSDEFQQLAFQLEGEAKRLMAERKAPKLTTEQRYIAQLALRRLEEIGAELTRSTDAADWVTSSLKALASDFKDDRGSCSASDLQRSIAWTILHAATTKKAYLFKAMVIDTELLSRLDSTFGQLSEADIETRVFRLLEKQLFNPSESAPSPSDGDEDLRDMVCQMLQEAMGILSKPETMHCWTQLLKEPHS